MKEQVLCALTISGKARDRAKRSSFLDMSIGYVNRAPHYGAYRKCSSLTRKHEVDKINMIVLKVLCRK